MKQKVTTPEIANCAKCNIPARLMEDWDFRDTWQVICLNYTHSTKFCNTGHRAICRWNNAQSKIATELMPESLLRGLEQARKGEFVDSPDLDEDEKLAAEIPD